MKHYEINVWAIALKMMLMFRRVLLAKKKDAYTRMDAVQFKVFRGCCLALTNLYLGKNLGKKLTVLKQVVVFSQNIFLLNFMIWSQRVVLGSFFFFWYVFFIIIFYLAAIDGLLFHEFVLLFSEFQ